MVLEAIFSYSGVRTHPVKILVMSILLSSFAIFISYHLFPNAASVSALLIVALGLMPIIHSIFVAEETAEARHPGPTLGFMARHFSLVKIYGWFFIGLVISYSFWFVVLPLEKPQNCAEGGGFECIMPTKDKVFMEQENSWRAITGGNFTEITTAKAVEVGKGYSECKNDSTKSIPACFELVFMNNTMVLLLAVLLSFLLGAGALWLLSWNASVMGLFIGKEILTTDIGMGILRAVSFVPHGIPELVGYFIGAIAGGIISVAITKKKYMTHEFEIIAKDVLILLFFALFFLLIGGIIEAVAIVSGDSMLILLVTLGSWLIMGLVAAFVILKK
ncbi:MAG: stage II sporulation protein M [Candidatus Diapherotrites archaeon]